MSLTVEAVYKAAWEGTAIPNCMIIYCAECDQSFLLVRGKQNEICEHFQARIEEQRLRPNQGIKGMAAKADATVPSTPD